MTLQTTDLAAGTRPWVGGNPFCATGPVVAGCHLHFEGAASRMYHPDILDGLQPRDIVSPPDGCPALVLNADYTPLSYYPLSLWPWQTAIKAAFLERVDIIAEYDRVIRSPNVEMRLPSVIALRQYVRPASHPAFTRFNLFLRDRFECQYCGHRNDLTFDHVVPRAYGGRTTWENVTTACAPCNLKKGGRTPAEAHMGLRQRAFKPTTHHLQENGRAFPPHYLHTTWRDYLYWDTELLA